jgi:hypothetical protein
MSGGQERSFKFSAGDTFSSDASNSSRPVLNDPTSVTVAPFLYIEGHLSANWEVTGWGAGVSAHKQHIYVYHSDTVAITFSGFDNPVKTSGTGTGAQSIAVTSEVKVFNENTDALLFDTGMVPLFSLNTIFAGPARSFTPGSTSGGMAIEFLRQINVTPDVGPGTYQNVGLITIARI